MSFSKSSSYYNRIMLIENDDEWFHFYVFNIIIFIYIHGDELLVSFVWSVTIIHALTLFILSFKPLNHYSFLLLTRTHFSLSSIITYLMNILIFFRQSREETVDKKYCCWIEKAICLVHKLWMNDFELVDAIIKWMIIKWWILNLWAFRMGCQTTVRIFLPFHRECFCIFFRSRFFPPQCTWCLLQAFDSFWLLIPIWLSNFLFLILSFARGDLFQISCVACPGSFSFRLIVLPTNFAYRFAADGWLHKVSWLFFPCRFCIVWFIVCFGESVSPQHKIKTHWWVCVDTLNDFWGNSCKSYLNL